MEDQVTSLEIVQDGTPAEWDFNQGNEEVDSTQAKHTETPAAETTTTESSEGAKPNWWDGLADAQDEETAKAFLKESVEYRKKYNDEFVPLQEKLPKLTELEKDFESIPLVKNLLEHIKNADMNDPADVQKKAMQFIRLQTTDYSGMADSDPVSLLVEAKMEENPLLDREEALELVRAQHKVSKDDYDHDPMDEESVKRAERLAGIALKEAKNAARQVALKYEDKKAKSVVPPSVQSRMEEQERAKQLAEEYRKVYPQHRSSLKELDYGDFKFKLEGIQPEGYEKTAANGYHDFMRDVAMDDKGYIDPTKIARNSVILQNHEKIVRAAYEQGKAEGVKTVKKEAANIQQPGHKQVEQGVNKIEFFS